MSKIKAYNHDELVSDNGCKWTGDNEIFYMDVRTNIIQSLAEWILTFKQMNNPCKWYNCADKNCTNEDHPECLEPDECFLVEMEIDGYDRDGSPIWERV